MFSLYCVEMVVMGRNPYLSVFVEAAEKDYLIAEEALDMLGISYLRDQCYMEISGGERQMVFLARAIAQEAAYFIMDEPTSHLDFYNQHGIMNGLRRIVEERGCCVIIAMHDPNLTMAFSDEVLMIKQGQLLKEGLAKEVMTADNLGDLYDMNLKIASLEGEKKVVFA